MKWNMYILVFYKKIIIRDFGYGFAATRLHCYAASLLRYATLTERHFRWAELSDLMS